MFPLKNTEAYIHANGYRSTLGKELAARDAEISELGSEIQALTNYVTDTGVKNIMPVSLASLKSFNTTGSWDGNVYTLGGITLTVATDSNGNVTGITANGSDADTLYFYVAKNVSLKSGTYTLNGCPSGGGTSKYIIYKTNLSELGEWVDSGNGKNFTLAADTTGIHFAIRITGNVSVANITFKPMIRDASITDPTYQPYAKTNVELTQDTTYKTGSFAAGESGFFHSLTIKQFGKVVTINGYVQNISPVGNTPLVLGTVSGVDMPPLDLRATAAIASAAYEDPSQMAYLTLTTSGELKVRCENAATNVAAYFSVSYIV